MERVARGESITLQLLEKAYEDVSPEQASFTMMLNVYRRAGRIHTSMKMGHGNDEPERRPTVGE